MGTCSYGWNDELRTGNDILDIQHKELMTKITYLMAEIENENTKAMSEAISYLTDYIFDHFTLEESLMLKTNYPDFERHRDEHSHYVKYIFRLRQKMLITPDLIDEVSRELACWFSEHILKTDIKMAEHLRKFIQCA
ncbi:MAG: bacteriohemerythrin [Nitrospirae bacterium]|nr:bacteriohemerythrin [Nitrospirota bacterium]